MARPLLGILELNRLERAGLKPPPLVIDTKQPPPDAIKPAAGTSKPAATLSKRKRRRASTQADGQDEVENSHPDVVDIATGGDIIMTAQPSPSPKVTTASTCEGVAAAAGKRIRRPNGWRAQGL
jgi:hypothetical protein